MKMPFTQSQIQDIKNIIKDTITEILNVGMVSDIVEKVLQKVNVENIHKNLATHEKVIEDLRKQNNKLVNKMESMEQFSRNNNIRIYGVSENKHENIEDTVKNLIHNKLNLNITSSNIERCHRIGKVTEEKYRAIVVRMTNYKLKMDIIKSRKALKGTGIIIAEDMTHEKHKLLKETVQQIGKENVWTMDGKIYAKVNNKKYLIKDASDLISFQ